MNYKQKVAHALDLLDNAWMLYRDGLVVAHSLGKDSVVVWDLAKRVSPEIRGFIITTQFKPQATKDFMAIMTEKYPELEVYISGKLVADDFPTTNPDECCELLKVEQTRRAIEGMNATCWATGLRKSEGHTRSDFSEIEHRDRELVKLNPILAFEERDVWAYIALNKIEVNPLYAEGFRSLGCEPCTRIMDDGEERDGRWYGTARSECGIHTGPLCGKGRGVV